MEQTLGDHHDIGDLEGGGKNDELKPRPAPALCGASGDDDGIDPLGDETLVSGRKRRRAGDAEAASDSKQPKKKEKSTLGLALADGAKLKDGFIKASAGYTMTMQNIKTDESWRWAAKCSGDLEQKWVTMEGLVTDFARRYFGEGVKDLKRAFAGSILEAETIKMCRDMKDAVEEVNQELKQLKAMHCSRLKA